MHLNTRNVLTIFGLLLFAFVHGVPRGDHRHIHGRRQGQVIHEDDSGKLYVSNGSGGSGVVTVTQTTTVTHTVKDPSQAASSGQSGGNSGGGNTAQNTGTATTATTATGGGSGGGGGGGGGGAGASGLIGKGTGVAGFDINTSGMKISSAPYSTFTTVEGSTVTVDGAGNPITIVQLPGVLTIPGETTVTPSVPMTYTSRALPSSLHPLSEPHAPKKNGDLTISIINNHHMPLTLAFDDGEGPTKGKRTSSMGHDGPSATTSYLYPSGWSGRVILGQTANYKGSKIEGSYFNNAPAIDVSYVDGYTVPIVCSDEFANPLSGCNLELFELNECDDLVDNVVCNNPAQILDVGPAPQFYHPCEGAAYIYPKDDRGTAGQQGTLFTCCVGVECPEVERQPVHNSTNTKYNTPSYGNGAATRLF